MPRRDPAAAARAAMPERYGRPRRHPMALVAAASVLAAGLGWVVWAAFSSATPDVVGGVVTYDVVSDSRTDITLEVVRRVTTGVRCDVYAQARDRSVVGERSVLLEPADAGTVTTTVQIETVRRAASAWLTTCTAA